MVPFLKVRYQGLKEYYGVDIDGYIYHKMNFKKTVWIVSSTIDMREFV